MSPDAPVEQLLEEMLNSGRTPEEVAGVSSELLEEVRERWEHLRRIEAQLQTLFPPSEEVPSDFPSPPESDAGLADIPGYEVTEILGRGGMGIVYRGVHLKLDRAVAIKMLLADRYATSHERAMLAREARAVAALRHPNIVQVFDVGEAGGCPYFTMEYMDGGTLAQRLDDGPMPVPDVTALIGTLARAVDAAHRHGIVHRDLKPANVLLTADGVPKVSDFGLAHRSDQHSDPAVSLMQTGMRIGTPSYMAPEQALGDRKNLGPASDVYALGAILYQMLTGRPPFLGESPAETERQLLSQEPVPPSRLNGRLPRDLETICLTCLQKSPSRRYRSAGELADDVQRFGRDEPIAARRTGRIERAAKWMRRYPGATTAAGALILLLVVVAVVTARLVWSRAQTVRDVNNDLATIIRGERSGNWSEARQALERAKGRLGEQPLPELRQQLVRAESELDLVAKLAAIRLSRAEVVGRAQNVEADRAYREAFAAAGLNPQSRPPAATAARIAASPVRQPLISALDDWGVWANGQELRELILEIARRADPDPQWRDKARNPAVCRDLSALHELAAAAPIADEPVSLLVAVSYYITLARGNPTDFCRRIQREHPGDFWANYTLAYVLHQRHSPEAINYYLAALALQPDALAVYVNLTSAYMFHGRYLDAIDCARRAARLDPRSALAHFNLGLALLETGRADEAVAACEKSIELDPSYVPAHGVLGQALRRAGRFVDAKAAADRCLSMLSEGDPDYERAAQQAANCAAFLEFESHLPDVLSGKEQPDPLTRRSFGGMCLLKRQYADAVRLYEEAFAADPKVEADLGGDARVQAACAAARAAEQLDDVEERARFVDKAVSWLRADVVAWTKLLDNGREDDRRWLVGKVVRWRADANLAAIREPDALQKLSPEQQGQCRALWREVNALLARAEAAAP